jgi:oligopeptide/dipeptide ABC transporter ATP-binding protein
MTNANDYLLRINNLSAYFPIKKGLLRRTIGYTKAVDGINLAVKKSQIFGLVGESGSGKTTVAKSIVRLIPNISGQIFFENTDILLANRVKLKQLRRQIGLIFQDPYNCLNPRMTVGNIISEPLRLRRKADGNNNGAYKSETERVLQLLLKVGLSSDFINRYPHEFSGGQRQRIAIARALAMEPKMIICDEPVSALDVSIQGQILNLLKDLHEEFGLTFLFIAHDLAVVEFFCDIVAVMYKGKILEQAPTKQIFQNPLHPYTQALICSVDQVQSPSKERDAFIERSNNCFSSSLNGCVFYPRCLYRKDICLKKMPALEPAEGGFWAWPSLSGDPEQTGEGRFDPVQPFGLVALPTDGGSKAQGHFIACWKCK